MSLPIRFGRSPPTSALRESFPSEKAPAPEKPVVIWQYGLQEAHFLVTDFGHLLSSTAFPFSTIRIFLSDPFYSISIAVNIPAGPAPTIATS